MSNKAQRAALSYILIAIVLVGAFSATWVYTNGFKFATTPGYTPAPPVSYTGQTQPGYAYCATTGTVAQATAPPLGCYNIAQLIQVHLYDLYAGASLSGYSCKFWLLTSGQWTFAESVTNTGSNGNCTTTGTYLPGTPVLVEACKLTTACDSTAFAQQKTTFYTILPSTNPSGIGAGTVAFSPIPATSTPTSVVQFPIIKLAGDAFATNTPNTITIAWANGTTFATSNTGFTTSGSKTIGTKFTLTFTLQVGTSGTEPSKPYGAGYASFTPIDLQSGPSAVGTLVGSLQMEIKATTGTHMVVPVSTPFTQVATLSATDWMFVYQLTDTQQTLAKDANGQPLPCCNGAVTFAGAFDATALSGTDVVTLTIDWYAYYSVNYISRFTVPNSQAVKVSGTNTVTIKV